MSTTARRAYRAAWHVRHRTGDASPSLLVEQLAVSRAEPHWSDPSEQLHAWLMDCWGRGVPPRRMPFEAMARIPTHVRALAHAYTVLLGHFEWRHHDDERR